MSLLLDARKKSQLSQGGSGSPTGLEQSQEEHRATPPVYASTADPSFGAASSGNSARIAGQNLFNAKSSRGLADINPNLLLALGATVLLLAAGAAYVWYIDSASNQPVHPMIRAPVAAPITQQPPAISEAPANNIAPPATAKPAEPAKSTKPVRAAKTAAPVPPQRAREKAPMQIVQHQAESIDPLLNGAYLAYREGKFDEAEQLYRRALKVDERNSDALLGLAAIAQRRGSDSTAAHYYARVLELNPRDPVANAGMSALTTDDNRESRLKTLLIDQQDSSPLHFALGNHYAAQERWAEAQRAYFNAYKLEPKNAALAFNLAVSLERLGQRKLAAHYYQSALQLDASHSEGFDHAAISQRIEELTGMARSQP